MSNESGPDFLGYFKHLVSELLMDHEALPFTEYKKEKLNVLLNEGADCIAEEIEKIKDQILENLHTDSDPRKEQLSYYRHKADERIQRSRKREASSVSRKDNGETGVVQQSSGKGLFEIQLEKMEQSLEDFLNIIVSKCRSMTHAEKERLGRRIKKLPTQALNRVVEIIQRGSSMEDSVPNEIFVDLEAQDDITLWRLYYYVETVLRANNLGSSNPIPFPLI